MTASGDFSKIESTSLLPKVSRTLGDVQSSLMGTRCSKTHGAQGPIPEPVATITRRRNRGTIRSTPKVGTPRTHICAGGLSICFAVQSPALLTTKEYPFLPGSGTVANPCHSSNGSSDMRVKLPGIGVASIFRYVATF